MSRQHRPGPRVVCAAMRMHDGLIVTGVRHFSPEMRATLLRIYGEDYKYRVVEQGFVDQSGNFLSRPKAWELAKLANQILLPAPDPGTLYSEDLY